MMLSSIFPSKPLIINTRPIERAASLTQHLQIAGFTVVDIPMLALQPRLISQTDSDIMRQWMAGDYQALVIVSPTAAALGLSAWQSLLKNKQIVESKTTKSYEPPCPIIAVGEATASVFRAVSYDVLQPKMANNEGMLAMSEIASLQASDKVLIWRGLGGRRLLVDALQERGIQVDSIAWYERELPESAMIDYEQWLASHLLSNNSASNNLTIDSSALNTEQTVLRKPIVIISSGTAFEHWISTVNQSKYNNTTALADFNYVVLGVRLAKIIAAQKLDYWQIEDLSAETILKAINSSKTRRN